MDYKQRSKRETFNILKAQLKNEASTFHDHWREISELLLPRRSRFFESDVNEGGKRHNDIIDNTGTLAIRTLRSGMMAGVTSPARPWFKLTLRNKPKSQRPAVKRWLTHVENSMRDVFLRSNLYNILPTTYGDLGSFSTGCMYMEEDIDDVVRFYSFPIGSYMLANDETMRVRIFMREFQMTVRQIVNRFAERNEKGEIISWDNISDSVKSNYFNGHLETWINVTHVIKPNQNYRPDSPLSKYKKFISCYYEESMGNNGSQSIDVFLSEKGYDYFPVLAPRWEVTSGDVYGTNGPGMEALGDVKQLQFGEKKGAKALDKIVDPPMVGPTSLKNARASLLPGDITYVDDRDGRQGFRAAHEINFDLGALENKQAQVRQRIQRAFYEDLFLMLANSDRRQITAREIEERHEEKLLALGPVLEQLNQDLLDPLIDNTFQIMVKRGLIPEPPEEIEGEDLKIEYVSIMSQAQKLAGIGGIDRFVGAMGQAAQYDQNILKKIDLNQYVDIYADLTGVPPKLVRSDEEVRKIEEREAEIAAQQEARERQQEQISSAKELSQIKTDEDSALSELMRASQAGRLT
jgi:hypothetical protein